MAGLQMFELHLLSDLEQAEFSRSQANNLEVEEILLQVNLLSMALAQVEVEGKVEYCCMEEKYSKA